MSKAFAPTPAELALVNQIFAKVDTQKLGVLTGDVAVDLFAGSGLSSTVLGEVWQLSDNENNGFLTRKGVAVAVRLMGHAQKGEKVTEELINKRECVRRHSTTRAADGRQQRGLSPTSKAFHHLRYPRIPPPDPCHLPSLACLH
jgi:epidermal growth factor receptor substrate 15